MKCRRTGGDKLETKHVVALAAWQGKNTERGLQVLHSVWQVVIVFLVRLVLLLHSYDDCENETVLTGHSNASGVIFVVGLQ